MEKLELSSTESFSFDQIKFTRPWQNMQAATENALCNKQASREIVCITVHCLCHSVSCTAVTVHVNDSLIYMVSCFCYCEIIQKFVSPSYLQYWTEVAKYAPEDYNFLYDACMKNKSYGSCKRKFCCKHHGHLSYAFIRDFWCSYQSKPCL
jgi:hypothetical protein